MQKAYQSYSQYIDIDNRNTNLNMDTEQGKVGDDARGSQATVSK